MKKYFRELRFRRLYNNDCIIHARKCIKCVCKLACHICNVHCSLFHSVSGAFRFFHSSPAALCADSRRSSTWRKPFPKCSVCCISCIIDCCWHSRSTLFLLTFFSGMRCTRDCAQVALWANWTNGSVSLKIQTEKLFSCEIKVKFFALFLASWKLKCKAWSHFAKNHLRHLLFACDRASTSQRNETVFATFSLRNSD